jgi:rhamnosyltransferase
VGTLEHVQLAVVVPTFNPPPNPNLEKLITTLALSGFPVLISDDASVVTHDPALHHLRQIPGVRIIRHLRNEGIARGLNEGLDLALTVGATWLLTLDQDSLVDSDYIPTLLAFANTINNQLWTDTPIGAVAPASISDSSGEITYPTKEFATSRASSLRTTEEVMQSGALWNVQALDQVGGFDENLAIDAVDAAACLRLREAGFVIAVTPSVTVQHNLGAARQVRLLGRTVTVTGHSRSRRASIMKNRLKLAPAEFKQSPQHAIRTLRRVAVNEILGSVMPKPKNHKD